MKRILSIFSVSEITYTALRFYGVGILLYIIPSTRGIFLWITPWVLLANLLIILAYHKSWNLKTAIVLSAILVFSFILEMYGVVNDAVFGAYSYETTLGIKFRHTPLLIGVNWLMLVYGAHACTAFLTRYRVLRILLGGLLMVCYDLIIEVVAPGMKMWRFDQGYPPLQNFVMWFTVSFVFMSIIEIFRINTHNKHARVLFLTQVGFFGILSIYVLMFL